MADQMTLFKGEKMEEQLRCYFLSSNYYVVRGIEFKYENQDITDVDLFLYNRSSDITRQRINVDIKNKDKPKAFERFLWANGLMKLLNFDSCIVATTDSRPVVVSFGQVHNTTVLNGTFLKKLDLNSSITKLLEDRLPEESLLQELQLFKDYKRFPNKTWKDIYQNSKSKLLTQQDFSGFNSLLPNIEFFIEKILIDPKKRETATRMLYITISHLLIIIDFLIKDFVFLEQYERERKLLDGFKYGNLGKEGINKIIYVAVKMSGNKSNSSISKILDNPKLDILKQYFGADENIENLFNFGKQFENLGFTKNFTNPMELEAPLKAVLAIFLDFNETDRKNFFGIFDK